MRKLKEKEVRYRVGVSSQRSCRPFSSLFAMAGIALGLFAPTFVLAEDLLSDEQGPTAEEAVATVTAGEDFLTPSYVVPTDSVGQTEPVPSEVDILNEIFGSPTPDIASIAKKSSSQTFFPSSNVKKQDEQPLLTPLPELEVALPEEKGISPKKLPFTRTSEADRAISLAGGDMATSLNMPREIRISYYKGQSGMNVQALKWIRAFAVRVVRDPRLQIEVRVSEKQWDVQQKRLKLLLQILKEEGVSVRQIRVFKSDRNPDNVLMGYVYDSEQTKMGAEKKQKEQKIIDW